MPKNPSRCSARTYCGGMTFLHKTSIPKVRAKRSHHPARGTAVIALSTLVGIVALTGCTTAGASADPSIQPFPNAADSPGLTGANGLPEKNIEKWVMPLDQYTVRDSKTSDYAENLLVEPCMESAGFSWNIPWQDIHATEGPSWNAAHFRLSSVDLAMSWGYHVAPATDTSRSAWIAFSQEKSSIGAAEASALTKCILVARKTLPALPGTAQLASGYAVSAWQGAQKDATVVAAAAKWHACMLPAGVSDLPDNPMDMPSPSIVKQFNITLSISPNPPTVSKAEIALATRDQKCRLSSNYSKAFYDAVWDRQAKLVSQNADALQRVEVILKKHDAAVAEVIASHAPTH